MGRAYQIMRDEAWALTGRRWRRAIITWEITRMVAPWASATVVLGALGYAVWWAWGEWVAPVFTGATTMPSPSVHPGAVPVWVWVGGLALAAYLFWLFRPGRIVIHRQRRIVQVIAVGFAFAGLLGAGLFGITGH